MAVALSSAPAAARAENTIWAECTSGSVTQPCPAASWYTSAVSVVWRASGSPESTSPCLLGIGYRFSSDTMTNLFCTANWGEPGKDTREFALHVEVSTPSSEAIPERPPDTNGWYNHSVTVTFKGHGYSGPASCRANGSAATATYGGPDTSSAAVSATCTDPAGKSVYPSFGLHYDSTAPTITGAYAARGPDYNGWYNHPVTFAFTDSDATSGVEPCTATYAGPDNPNAELVGTCFDRAGNAASLRIPLHYQATPPALSVAAQPGDGQVSFRWRASANVQIVRYPGVHGPHAASVLYEGHAGSFTDKRPRDGVKYIYKLNAKDVAGNVTTRSLTITPNPRLIAPVEAASVTAPPLLRWTPVRGASYYNVQLFRGRKLLSTWPVHSTLQLGRAWRYGERQYRLSPGRYTWYVWPGYGPLSAAHYGSLIGHRTFIVRSPQG
jgi:hypothetical protein